MPAIVTLWNRTRDHLRLGTYPSNRDFDLDSVRCPYRLRWQIALLFKEWKSYADLKSFCTRKAPIAARSPETP